MIPKIKYIIWDWNGTLINDAWLFVELMNEELVARNLPLIDINSYRESFTFPVKKYYEELGFNFKVENFKEVGFNFIQKFKKRKFEAILFPETIKILNHFKEKKINQAIVSAQEDKLLNETIKHYNIYDYFRSISGIEHYYADNKIILAKTIRNNISCDDNQIVMIGDSAHDSEVAEALNINCILFSGGHYSKKRLLKCNRKIIDCHSELLKILI